MKRNFAAEPLTASELADIPTVRAWSSQGWANAGPVSLKVMEHYIDRADVAEKRVEELQRLIMEALPWAMRASCSHSESPDADPTWHCCDWSAWIEKAMALIISQGLSLDVEAEKQ
jgi:hypothetical protein